MKIKVPKTSVKRLIKMFEDEYIKYSNGKKHLEKIKEVLSQYETLHEAWNKCDNATYMIKGLYKLELTESIDKDKISLVFIERLDKILDAHGHYWKTIIGLPSTTTCWYATDIEKMHAHWHETESGMPDFAGETMDKETRRLCNALRACSHHGAIGFVSKYAAGGAVDPVAESKWQADKLRELLILEFGD